MVEEKLILETALLCSQNALSMQDMKVLLAGMPADDMVLQGEISAPYIERLLSELESDWSGKGLELVQVADGWRFQSRAGLRPWLARLNREKLPRYGRATMEILAIITYNQPVTRGDIEQIRGVMVNPQAMRTLEERGWIEVVGHRETPGRPALWATTAQFLGDMGLVSLEQLPPLAYPEQGADTVS
ncbi:MAG: SMC-Scp complex subunit ScpB [Burkholderiaceae bacterium]|jgi:segregation and condensation protein B|nr:SMC-Scp complex subunit ScpB [Burkholderiaceae bacterium]